MRRSEITPELIELSKRAKELGFPQVVEEGDWVHYHVGRKKQIVLVDKSMLDEFKYANIWLEEYTLILSFSRCLDWLREKGWWLSDSRHCLSEDEGGHWRYFVEVKKEQPYRCKMCDAKTHHEAIAKAVIKILEEEQCK